ncbi:winged helix-turn-helix domain-containing protein [Phenylobacterium sp.]|uniref:winged helix-turn-helix domain-containing protein n=1 Tax=Phenylobacterium sp. TaxID=1871053 RepID=UPI002F42DEBA
MSADSRPAAVHLAHEAPFDLGSLHVRPSTRQVMIAGVPETIEPRIMEVLVALARRRSEVVSRDDLLAACWRGRAVGEDAINRCISGVRRLAKASGGFSVTTIARVGYRLDASRESMVEPVVLAVLAFDNLSGDPQMAYFSDGVSEEILQAVARGAGLKVIGRGSSFQFRGPDKAAAKVGAALRATHVLDGAVRRSGGQVRISASLIECAGETTLWSDRFDRQLSDVFALQDEIAAAVAAALKVAFAPLVPAETIDPAALDLYLKALEIRNQRGLLDATTIGEIIGLLQAATRLAPRFVRAWVFLATVQVEQLRFQEDEPRPRTGVTRADVVAVAQAALALDQGAGGAYQALGQLEAFGRFAERDAFHAKALAAAPNDPTVLTNASLFYAEVGRIEDAIDLARQAYDLDPMYPWAANWYLTILDFAGRGYVERAQWASLCERWPDNQLILWGALCFAAERPQSPWFDDLVAEARERELDAPVFRHTIGYGKRLRAADPSRRTPYLQNARKTLAEEGALPLWVFTTLCRFGFIEETFDLIDQASFAFMFDPDLPSPNGATGPALIFSVIHNAPMMHDPRFVRLCAKLGLCAYWLETGRWPDCAASAPYDFKAEARRLAIRAGEAGGQPATA